MFMSRISFILQNIGHSQFFLTIKRAFIEDEIVQIGITTIKGFHGFAFLQPYNDKRCAVNIK